MSLRPRGNSEKIRFGGNVWCTGKDFCISFRILMFEEKMKEKERPKGLPPKRDLSSLP